MRCWKGACQRRPAGDLHAQWTVVDYLDYATCERHVAMGLAILSRKRCDGQLPVDVWVTYWWPVEGEQGSDNG